MTPDEIERLDWSKGDGLLPAIVQDARTGRVLMLGYMNAETLRETLTCGKVVFYSRSRGERWLKGESSGHFLEVEQVSTDCDSDALLLLVSATGPTCHLGTVSCFDAARPTDAQQLGFLGILEKTIAHRMAEQPEGSYTARLVAQGPSRIAQKVGEEGLETALAAVTRDDAGVVGESADLIYHLMVLLKSRNLSLSDVARELQSRHAAKP